NRDAAGKIEIAASIDIPNVVPLASLQHEIEPCIRRHNKLPERLAHRVLSSMLGVERRALDVFFGLHNTTSVPTPASVKISSKTECGILPSTNCTFSTPLSIAATALSTFGIIPRAMTAEFFSSGTSAADK